jgi:RNA polymerase sigma factor (sigma-70 family)
MTSDLDLLQQFARENSPDAFREIVRRHVDLVYSAALRQVRSPQLAEEIAQSVFADLASQARKLKPDTVLTAWLYAVTRRTAIDAVRKESRRQLREQIAVEMNHMNATADDWTQIAPLLDDAMAALDETDRVAVLLRYFENKSLRDVGASLNISDDAAQKRVSRAVERLREFFSKQRLTIGATGLVAVISANAVQSAPIELSTTISATMVKTAAGVGLGAKGLAATKIGTALGSAVAFLPILGQLFFVFKAKLEDAASPRDRRLMSRFYVIQFILGIILIYPFYGFFSTSSFAQTKEALFFVGIIFCVIGLLYSFKRHSKERRQIQIEEGTRAESTSSNPQHNTPKKSMYMNLASACGMLTMIVILWPKIFHKYWHLDALCFF